jgi:putative ABC transport system ATP-binding protein
VNVPSVILEVGDLRVEATAAGAGPVVSGASFAVGAGECVAIWGLAVRDGARLADVLSGVEPPASGTVRFEGIAWEERSLRDAAAARGLRIGRVFAGTAWLSNLDVDENVTLPSRHFTGVPRGELLAQAEQIARRLGLADLPGGRPAWADERELQLAQWVRAFLPGPALFVLENPLAHLRSADAPPVRDVLREARARGAGVLCLAPAASPALAEIVEPDRRYTAAGGAWTIE